MNAPQPPLSAEALVGLRRDAQAAGQSIVLRVQEQFGLDPDAAVRMVAAQPRLPAFDMAALNAVSPDFSHLSFNEAARRHCLAARDQDRRVTHNSAIANSR